MASFILKKTISKDILHAASKVPVKRKLNDMTIMEEGEGQLTGAIGELMMLDLFDAYYEGNTQIDHANTYDYDIVLDDRYKLDVKSKRRGAAPRSYYNATVAAYSLPIQKCAGYYFTSITFDYTNTPKVFYFLGSLSKRQFKELATFGKLGEEDGSTKANGDKFKFTADCWNVQYGDLEMFSLSEAKDLRQSGFEIVYW